MPVAGRNERLTIPPQAQRSCTRWAGQKASNSLATTRERRFTKLLRDTSTTSPQMNLKPGMRVLDVGCGVGGPAREIARFVDVEIVGANNNVGFSLAPAVIKGS